MINILKGIGLSLIISTAVAGSALKNEPQLRYNASVRLAESGTLLTRDLFDLTERDYYSCPTGYDECSTDTSRCCPSGTGNGCCANHSCTEPGDTCCVVGTCPSGWDCCGNDGYCSPSDGECCNEGYYCTAGNHCRLWDGEAVCCPSSGCIGEGNSGDLGSTVDSGDFVTTTTKIRTTETSITSTYSYTYADYEYFYTTYYWSYWYYFWTSTYPYSVSTVTSTETTTTTVWSAYATNSADAEESFSYSASIYTTYIPFAATYLKSSTGVVPESTAEPTGLRSGGGSSSGDVLGSNNAASSVLASSTSTLMSALFAVLTGALAIGL